MSEEEKPGPPAARSVEEARAQARELRGRIDQDLKVLEERMPPPERLRSRAKVYGGVGAAGLATLGAGALAYGRRSEQRRRERDARLQAEALAQALPEAALHVRQEQVSARFGRVGLVVAVVALGVAVWARLAGASGPSPSRRGARATDAS